MAFAAFDLFGGGITRRATVTAGDLARFSVQVSSALADGHPLNEALRLDAGALVIVDSHTTNQPNRFYRVVETP